jgi:hypothetical protein
MAPPNKPDATKRRKLRHHPIKIGSKDGDETAESPPIIAPVNVVESPSNVGPKPAENVEGSVSHTPEANTAAATTEVAAIDAQVNVHSAGCLSSTGGRWLCFGVVLALIGGIVAIVVLAVTSSCTCCKKDGTIDDCGSPLPTFPSLLGRPMGELQELKDLILVDAHLTGTIGTEIGLLTALRSLKLERNYRLKGTIPTELGRLTRLTSLDLFINEGLTGTLPTEIGQLTALKFLTIAVSTEPHCTGFVCLLL